jgi:Tfp pilus assembly protein PilX
MKINLKKEIQIIKKSYKDTGEMLVYLMIIVFLFTTMMLPVVSSITVSSKYGNASQNKEMAVQIAEAGVNYYQWHLAHFPSDYKDGTSVTCTSTCGPFVHTYIDTDTGLTIGQYSLTITPPTTGSTIITIKSVGNTTINPSVTRTVTARYGVPSLAQFSFLTNDVIWIGSGETVSGQMQSNNGIRFDGVGNAPILSAKSTYTCPSGQGSPCPATKNGVWGSASTAIQSYWQFPVPSVDFSALTANLSTMKSSAQSAGLYLPPSTVNGYSLVFNSAGTVSVYKITSLVSEPSGVDVNNNTHNEDIDYSARTLLYTVAIPSNGIIYAEDNVWVEGTVKGRVMVAAAVLPYSSSTAPTIYIPNNILYAAKDGTNVLGLLAQNNVVVTYGAPTNLEVDAAMIAQNGSAQFFDYLGVVKNSITVFGSVMSYGQWTWSWVNGGGTIVSGFTTTNDAYDGNLLYGPPPGFPLSSAGYQQLSWISD